MWLITSNKDQDAGYISLSKRTNDQMTTSSDKQIQTQRCYQHQDKQKDIQNKFEANIGVVFGQWFKSNNRPEVICYGTGFAISKHVVITCAHNVYHQTKKRQCDRITFIPNIKQGKITAQHKIYQSTKLDFLGFQKLKSGQTYAKQPLSKDIALVYISQELQIENYPQIGLDDDNSIRMYSKIDINGYPSQQFYNYSNFKKANFNQVNLQGNLLEIDDSTIYHNLKTSVGHSGSAILGLNLQGQTVVLGVHTHKGNKKNSGVYLSKKNIQKLIEYEIQFALNHQQYKLSINFPKQLKQKVIKRHSVNVLRKILQKDEQKVYIIVSKILPIEMHMMDIQKNNYNDQQVDDQYESYLEKYFSVQIKRQNLENMTGQKISHKY